MLAALALVLAVFEAPLTVAVVAGGAVSIPIIIHLLNRKRFKVVSWAAMRFLLAAQRKNSRRMRLEQLILLVVRCLVVLLIVLAMASVSAWAESLWRWFLPNAAVALQTSSARTHKVLVLDGSLSMGARQGDRTAFDRAKGRAIAAVKESPRGDAFSVVLMSAPPRRIVPEPSEDPQKVIAEIEALRLPHGNADLAATLNTIDSLLQSSPGKFPEKEVFFFTDLQKSTWIASQQVSLSIPFKRARTILVDAGGDETGNIAVTGLNLMDGQDLAVVGRGSILIATLHNYGQETKEVSVKLLVGRARSAQGEPVCELVEKAERIVRVDRNQDVPVPFEYKFQSPGDHVVQVQVQNDVLPLDDMRSAVLTVKRDLPVLLVNGKSFGDPFDQSAEWLRLALNPFGNPGEGTSVVKPRMISTANFTDETLGDLSGYDCVFLCDVPSLNLAEARRLEAHVRRGGGVVLCMGGQVQVGEYNRLLYNDERKLLPLPLVGVQSSGSVFQYQLALEPDSDRTPPIKAFRADSDRQTLVVPRFSRFIQTGNPGPGLKPRRVLSFVPVPIAGKEIEARTTRLPPGGPAILEWNPPATQLAGAKRDADAPATAARMRGRVVLVTSAVNSDWSGWPASPSYPALMNELLVFAATGRLQEQSIEVGQSLELYLSGAAGAEAIVQPPEGKEERGRTQNLDDGSVLRWSNTDSSGVYRVRLGQAPQEHLFAVNVPATNPSGQGSESDLTRTDHEELQKVYPEWEFQVVKELNEVVRKPRGDTPQDVVYQPLGTGIARWLLLIVLGLVFTEAILAWVFGHYTTAATTEEDQSPRPISLPIRVLNAMPWLLLFVGLGVGGVLIHDAITTDFLGFLPETMRRGLEAMVGIPAPAEGEGSRWRLEYSPYFLDPRNDPWLATGVLLGGVVLIWWIYSREGQKPTTGQRIRLIGLRLGVLLLLLGVLLPQLKLHFERQGWPDVVLLVDDSQSMSAMERYTETDVREAADDLAKEASRLAEDKRTLAAKKEELAHQKEEAGQKSTPDIPEKTRLLQESKLLLEQARLLEKEAESLEKASTGANLQRLHLVQALATRNDLRWLSQLVQQRKVKVHVYHCSTRSAKLAQATVADEVGKAAEAIQGLVASPRNDSSQLGAAVRQVINDFRGSSLAAVIMLTDGVTTEGEDLVKVSKYAGQLNVPLFFVGVGDAHEVRDVYLHDLQAEESVYVNDKMVFELKLTGQGYKNLSVPVVLREKGKTRELDRQMVQIEPGGKPIKVRLQHQPTEQGEKTFIIDTPVHEDEVEKDNNRLEKQVSVREIKLIKVLYVEGYRRYEYHYLKTLLERESNRVKGNKTIELKTLLLDADPDYVRSDRTALAEFPLRKELDTYDVLILGDVDLHAPKMEGHLKDLAGFVQDRGGGLLMIAGEKYSPHTYKLSPLRDVMPIDLIGDRPDDPDTPRTEGYRLEMTPGGRVHPIFRFSPDEQENDEIWGRLRELYWYADGYIPKRAAEVLAVHPRVRRIDRKAEKEEEKGTGLDNHPLVLQQFVGSGRCLFFGFNESWRWGFREDQQRYNQFWIQAVRYLARSRLGRIDLKLDRQTHYRRGEPIKVTVRFPDDAPPPAADTEVKVVLERKLPGKAGDREMRTLNLARMEGSRTAFEAVVTQTPEGEYQFWLSVPAVPDPKPKAECKVTAPPGEMYGLRMNQTDMETAAAETRGRFYTLASAENLLKDLQINYRVTVSTSGPPWNLWNHVVFFLLALLLFTTEWLLRKRLNLL